MNKKFYLLGINIQNSFSPIIHQTLFKHLGLPYTYHIFQKSMPQFLNLMNTQDFGGASITMPYKMHFKDKMQFIGVAKQIQSINTIVKQDNKFQGYNTDYEAIKTCLPNHKLYKSLVIGSGATAFTVLKVLKQVGIPSIVASRSDPPIDFKQNFPDSEFIPLSSLADSPPKLFQNDILIGTTPSVELALSPNLFKNKPYVFDVNYYSKQTHLIKKAVANQVPKQKIQNGIRMLVEQGLKQNFLFTGKVSDEPKLKADLLQKYELMYN